MSAIISLCFSMWLIMTSFVQIHCIDSGRKSMIGVGKSLWSYLKCWMGLLMLVLSLLKPKSKLSGREQIVPSVALIGNIGENLFGIFDKCRANLSPFCGR